MSAALAARMEHIARDVAAEWHLALGPRIAAGRYSYVAPAGDDAILKVVPPEDGSADQQIDALLFWNGDVQFGGFGYALSTSRRSPPMPPCPRPCIATHPTDLGG